MVFHAINPVIGAIHPLKNWGLVIKKKKNTVLVSRGFSVYMHYPFLCMIHHLLQAKFKERLFNSFEYAATIFVYSKLLKFELFWNNFSQRGFEQDEANMKAQKILVI